METENTLTVILAILAILISIVAIAGVDLSKSESVDLSGIGENTLLITTLQGDVEALQDGFDDVDCEVTQDDLDELESDIKKYARDKAGEDGEDGKDGADGEDGTCTCGITANDLADLEARVSDLEDALDPDDFCMFSLEVYRLVDDLDDILVDEYFEWEANTVETFIHDSPGTYYLDIGALWCSWNVIVENYNGTSYEPVLNIGGTSDTTTNDFEITGDKFRLTYITEIL